jgi:hypothetical protein
MGIAVETRPAAQHWRPAFFSRHHTGQHAARPCLQAFPGGLRSPRLQHMEFLGALGTLSAELALLRGCTSVHTLAVTCPPRATGALGSSYQHGRTVAALTVDEPLPVSWRLDEGGRVCIKPLVTN